jgi:hypothetical protein
MSCRDKFKFARTNERFALHWGRLQGMEGAIAVLLWVKRDRACRMRKDGKLSLRDDRSTPTPAIGAAIAIAGFEYDRLFCQNRTAIAFYAKGQN